MSKVVFLADVHMGAGSRQKDIMWSLQATSRYCKDHDITEIIVLGDLFHDRQSISIEVLCDAFEFFKQCKDDGQTWIVFPGNHDMFLKYSWEVNSLKPFGDVLTIIDDVKLLKLDNSRFWILPFIYSESAYMRVLSKIEEQHEPGDVLLTHIGVRSATLNICFLLQDWSAVDFTDSKFDRVYTGHFHLKQKVGDNVWYPGSIIPFKFDEGDSEHGFYVYDTDKRDHEFVNIWDAGRKYIRGDVPPQFCTFHDDLLNEKDKSDVANNIIRVAMTREYTPNEKDQIRTKFMDMGAKRITFMDLVKDDQEVIVEDDNIEAIDLGELFKQFMEADTKGTKGLRPNLLTRLDREVREEGDEIYSKIDRD